MKNQLAKIVEKLQSKPQWLRNRLLNFALSSTIKFIGTAGVQCLELNQKRAVFKLKNRKKVRNHIGTVHAAATSLLAETASGMVLGMNIPDDKIPLLKNMQIEYIKRTTGNLKATATITNEQVEQLHLDDKGEMLISVTVVDDAQVEPVICQMLWAWIPKQKP
jgi:acyl-coenzyme A thioesterase PaaI-like protein